MLSLEKIYNDYSHPAAKVLVSKLMLLKILGHL